MKPTMTINLAPDRFDKHGDRESLGQLLERCAKISKMFQYEGEQRQRKEMRWIAKWAIRAVCKEILGTGSFPMPLEVSFTRLWQRPVPGCDFKAGRN